MSETEQAASSSTSGLAAGGDIGQKFQLANEKKAAGDEAFKKGDVNAGTSAIAFLVWYCVSDIDNMDSSCAVPHSEYSMVAIHG